MSANKPLRKRSPCFLLMGRINRKRPAKSRFFCSNGGQTLTKQKGKQMKSTRQITIEHIVLASNQPYEKVLEALESRLGSEEGWRKTEQRIQALAAAQAPLYRVHNAHRSALHRLELPGCCGLASRHRS